MVGIEQPYGIEYKVLEIYIAFTANNKDSDHQRVAALELDVADVEDTECLGIREELEAGAIERQLETQPDLAAEPHRPGGKA